MKFAMMAVALAATGAVRGDDVLFLDDFEMNSAKRVGEPALVSGMTSPGLLTQTRMGVYLFDSGYLLAWKKDPPYEFKVDFTEDFFAATDYMRPGRQKLKPRFDGNHALVAFAEDADGRIAKTDPVQFHIVSETAKSRPYEGKAHAIPGEINPARFDEGGQGVVDIAYTCDGLSLRNYFFYGEPPFDVNRVKEWLK